MGELSRGSSLGRFRSILLDSEVCQRSRVWVQRLRTVVDVCRFCMRLYCIVLRAAWEAYVAHTEVIKSIRNASWMKSQ